MKLEINPSNKKYYSEDFIKGFECGVERQFEKDKAELTNIVEQTDGDLISRQAVSKYVSKMINNRTYPEERQILEDFIEWLDNLPSAEK
jgi:ATP-dependent Lon protease